MSSNLIQRLFPFLQWWPMVTAGTLRADLVAGLTGAIVVLPQGVAFATIAGMPPEYGLYAAIVPAIVSALFGSSWHLISGPTTAASLVMFASLSTMAEPGSLDYVSLALTLTFMVGITQVLMGAARLGTLVNFISHSVIIGFTAGAAIHILASQTKTFFGLDMPRGMHPHEVVLHVFDHASEINWYIAAVAMVTLLSGALTRKFLPKMPYMIVAMITGSLAAVVLENAAGTDLGITKMGALAGTFPPLSSPDFSLETIKQLAPAVLAVTLLALTEAVSISRSIAVRSGQHIEGNQEFIGQGLSNIAGSFFSAYVATGSFNRSGLNYEAGAKTPMSAIVAGITLVPVMMLAAPLASYLPLAAMAGILFLVAWGLIDFHHIKQIMKTSRSEAMVLSVTFVATLLLHLEFAIILGVILSLVVYLNKTSKPLILTRVPDPRLENRRFNHDPVLPECPQLKIVRIDGSIFFGAVQYVAEKFRGYIKQNPEQKFLLILARGINFVDVAGAELLVREAKKRKQMGGKMYLYRVKPGACEVLQHGFLDEIGHENLFQTKSEAISTIVSQLDPEKCRTCKKRIFNECEQMPKEA